MRRMWAVSCGLWPEYVGSRLYSILATDLPVFFDSRLAITEIDKNPKYQRQQGSIFLILFLIEIP